MTVALATADGSSVWTRSHDGSAGAVDWAFDLASDADRLFVVGWSEEAVGGSVERRTLLVGYEPSTGAELARAHFAGVGPSSLRAAALDPDLGLLHTVGTAPVGTTGDALAFAYTVGGASVFVQAPETALGGVLQVENRGPAGGSFGTWVGVLPLAVPLEHVGVLALDPVAPILPLQPYGPGGTTSSGVPIPADASLAGAEVRLQSVAFPPGGGVVLSNPDCVTLVQPGP